MLTSLAHNHENFCRRDPQPDESELQGTAPQGLLGTRALSQGMSGGGGFADRSLGCEQKESFLLSQAAVISLAPNREEGQVPIL